MRIKSVKGFTGNFLDKSCFFYNRNSFIAHIRGEFMKKIILFFTITALSLSVAASLGQAGELSPGGIRRNETDLGLEVSHITYKEPGLMQEKGMMYGAAGSYSIHTNKLRLKFDGRLACGRVDYDGQLSNGTPYTVSGISDLIFEPRVSVGYDYAVSTKTLLTPYAGLGYRYLFDNLAKDVHGYNRESNYLYSPVGLDAVVSFENGWSAGAIAEYDLFWYGLQRSHLGDVYNGVDVVNNDQTRGYGARGSIKIQKKTERVDFIIEPFLRYWNIGQSKTSAITASGTNIIGYGYEPKNNSTEYGVKIAAKF